MSGLQHELLQLLQQSTRISLPARANGCSGIVGARAMTMCIRDGGDAAVGVADYALALEWEGTYLAWLSDTLLANIFGPLQLLIALQWAEFRVLAEHEGRSVFFRPTWPLRLGLLGFTANHYSPPWESCYSRYFVPIKSNQPPPAIAHLFAGTVFIDPKRRRVWPAKCHRGKCLDDCHECCSRSKRQTFELFRWLSDVLLLSFGMHTLPPHGRPYRIDYAEIDDVAKAAILHGNAAALLRGHIEELEQVRL